jgi:hypothetical protein
VKKPVAAALVIAASIPTLALPAGAAVPKKKAQLTISCADGTGHSARVWYVKRRSMLTRLAAYNPCARTLVLIWNRNGGSETSGSILGVAPGAHFNRHTSFYGDNLGARLDEPWSICGGEWHSAWWVAANNHGRIMSADDAPVDCSNN